jgi:L-alanine-DL-glutamate epimerase-like enolase superfamily enzyme
LRAACSSTAIKRPKGEVVVRVTQLSAFSVRIPLKRPIRHASHSRCDTNNLIVRATLEDGTQGFGEGVPRDYVTGETIESAIGVLQETPLGEQLGPCASFADAVHLAERLSLEVPGDERQCQANAARCALELAVLDAYGKHFQKPLSDATRILAPALSEPRDWVRYSGVIASANGPKAHLAAWRIRLWRFPDLKVKIGMAGHDDLWRLRTIRKIVGRKKDIRVDANEAWPVGEVAKRLEELEPLEIRAVEQPVPHESVAALAEARRSSKIAIVLDESLCSLVDAGRAVQFGTCDVFNIRLSKCGGFIPSLRIAEFARKKGLGYQLGCQVGETAILSAAGRHFAASVAGLRYVEGSYDWYLVREPLAEKDITFHWGGWAPALKGPGLDIEIDSEALTRVTIRQERLLG